MFARYRDCVEQELRQSLVAPRSASDFPAALHGMLAYHLGWVDEVGDSLGVPAAQGKALRPTLCLFACEALGGHWESALPAAVALELVHNFSLIHDDIQDGDTERRHRATVWTLWGQPQALQAGNAMRSIADITALELARTGVTEAKVLRASALLTEGYLDMTRGQCQDLVFEGTLDISQGEYLTMIACKTGALLRRGIEIGAMLATEQQATVQAFANCGSALGLAFQVRDDVLGIWGDEATTGKAVGSDILRKKKSFPVVYALEVAVGASRQKLIEVYQKDVLDRDDVEDVLDVLEELGAADKAEQVTQENAEFALEAISRTPLPEWSRQEVEDLVDFLTARQY